MAAPIRARSDAEWVHRFGLTERLGHWWTVATLAVAALSGLAMGDDASGPIVIVHVGAVVGFAVGALAILVFGNRRSLRRAAAALLWLDRSDRKWLAAKLRHPLGKHPEPQWGMFNAGQKVMSWALAASLTGLVISGIYALGHEDSGGPHAAFAIGTGLLVAAHVFMAVVNPATRHALNGMVHGRVRRSWAAHHHPRWLSSVGHS